MAAVKQAVTIVAIMKTRPSVSCRVRFVAALFAIIDEE